MLELIKNKTTRIVLITIAVILLLGGVYWFFSKDEEAKAFENDIKQNRLSYPDTQYYVLANIIEVASANMGTDEEAIFNVFDEILNYDDLMMLYKAFGKRSFITGGILWDSDLTEVLHFEMTTTELSKINGDLAAKGINFII